MRGAPKLELLTQMIRTQSNANDLMDDETVYDEVTLRLRRMTQLKKTIKGPLVPKTRDWEKVRLFKPFLISQEAASKRAGYHLD